MENERARVTVQKHYLPPTKLIPNSRYPLLYYPGILSPDTKSIASQFYDLLSSNGWKAHWIFRYGQTQDSHYHTTSHECMVVLTGHATIRFGVADTTEDMNENTYGAGREDGGIELKVKAGDVILIPAGVAHKTYDAKPDDEFKLMSPGNGHGLPPDAGKILDKINLTGFTMMGSYPVEVNEWDFATGGEGAAAYAEVWSVPPPKLDPVLGESENGLLGLWKQTLSEVPGRERVPSKL